jgi:hypothetical protein
MLHLIERLFGRLVPGIQFLQLTLQDFSSSLARLAFSISFSRFLAFSLESWPLSESSLESDAGACLLWRSLPALSDARPTRTNQFHSWPRITKIQANGNNF